MTALRIAALGLAATATIGSGAAAQTRPMGGAAAQTPQPAAQGEIPQARQEKSFPFKVPWVAVSQNGRAFGGERPSITLDQTLRMQGFGGCNPFSVVAYPLRQQTLAVGPINIGKKACDKGTMDSEKQFLVALRTAQQWDLVGTSLVIRGGNGELRFERAY